MPTPQQSRAALAALTEEAVGTVVDLSDSLSGSAESVRVALLDTVPGVIDYYSDGTGALAADFYDERRVLANAKGSYVSEIVVTDRTVRVRRGIAWASEPLFGAMTVTLRQRLAEIVQAEVARPYRDTIRHNRRMDPAAVGWRRVTNNCCGFCRMLAGRGAVYRQESARFASHPHCDCGAEPVFDGQAIGPEASVMQYLASKRSRTPRQRAELRAYLAEFYPD